MSNDLKNYLKEIFTEGKNWVFTLFDILGITLFFFPPIAHTVFENQKIIDITGIMTILLSYTFANFTLYRKLAKRNLLNPQSILIYHAPANRGEIHYIGKEVAKDLSIKLLFVSFQKEEIAEEVNSLLDPEKDNKSIYGVKVIKENDHFLFNLPDRRSTMDGKVTIVVNLTGADSGIKIEKKEIVEVIELHYL